MAKTVSFKKRELLSQIEEMNEVISGLLDDQDIDREEIRYLFGFLTYKGLEEEYRYFRENAHEIQNEDEPFPSLTL